MRISDWSSDVCSSDLSSRSKERHLPTTGNKTAHGGREQLVTKISEQIVKVNDVISVDDGHGIVVGYAIVTKVRDDAGVLQDYFDLNVDVDGIHTGEADQIGRASCRQRERKYV